MVRLLATLTRIEAIKTFRRLGFWMTALALGGLLTVIAGTAYYGAVTTGNPPPHLPEAWPSVAGLTGPLTALFGAVALILLVAAEFSWKTARQNVIDGLSKDQFFLAKLWLVPALAVFFFSVQVGIVGGVAVLGNVHLGMLEWPWIEGVHVGLLAGLLLQIIGYLSLAFLAAMIARSAGGSMGLFFLYAAILEQVLGGILREREGWLAASADLLPVTVFTGLTRPAAWDREALAAAVERAVSRGQPPPEVLTAPVSVPVALAWIGVLILASLAVYRKKDL